MNIRIFILLSLLLNSISSQSSQSLTLQSLSDSNDIDLLRQISPEILNQTESLSKSLPTDPSDPSYPLDLTSLHFKESEFPTPQPNLRGYSTKPMKSQYLLSFSKPVLNILPSSMIDSIKYPHSKPSGYHTPMPIQAEVAILSAKVMGGGKEAVKALKRLNVIANQYGMAKFIHNFPLTGVACKLDLMKKSELIDVKRLCEALFVRTTNAPVTNQHVDPKTGSEWDEETSFVVPRPSRIYNADKEIAKLRAGASVEDIVDYAPTHYDPSKDLK